MRHARRSATRVPWRRARSSPARDPWTPSRRRVPNRSRRPLRRRGRPGIPSPTHSDVPHTPRPHPRTRRDVRCLTSPRRPGVPLGSRCRRRASGAPPRRDRTAGGRAGRAARSVRDPARRCADTPPPNSRPASRDRRSRRRDRRCRRRVRLARQSRRAMPARHPGRCLSPAATAPRCLCRRAASAGPVRTRIAADPARRVGHQAQHRHHVGDLGDAEQPGQSHHLARAHRAPRGHRPSGPRPRCAAPAPQR